MHTERKRPRFANIYANMPGPAAMAPPLQQQQQPPSRLVLVSNLLGNTSEQDLLDEMREHGSVLSISMLPFDRQALVEFERPLDAKMLIDRVRSGYPATVRDTPVTLCFARPGEFNQRSSEYASVTPSSILLLTVFRPSGELNCDIFKRVGNQFGRLLRVSVLRGRHLQSVLEYASVEEALRAKKNLNGADIYPDCNTLLCEFTSRRVQDLLLRDGCSLLEEWRQGGVDARGGVGGSLLEPVGIGALAHRDRPDSPQPQSHNIGFSLPEPAQQRHIGRPVPHLNPIAMPQPPHPSQSMMMLQPAGTTGGPGCLLYVSNLPDDLNCDKLFNVLCLYGNVRLIKFFSIKRGMAMAEMMDPQSAVRCVNFLDNEYLFGTRFSVRLSHEEGIRSAREGGLLADGTPAIKHYDGPRSLNRFITEKPSRKALPIKPSKTVYFWGHPPNASEEQLRELLIKSGAPEPPEATEDGSGVDYFPGDHRSGLLRYENSSEALTAICAANHKNFPVQPGESRPWMLKMCFSLSEKIRQTGRSKRLAPASAAGAAGGSVYSSEGDA